MKTLYLILRMNLNVDNGFLLNLFVLIVVCIKNVKYYLIGDFLNSCYTRL